VAESRENVALCVCEHLINGGSRAREEALLRDDACRFGLSPLGIHRVPYAGTSADAYRPAMDAERAGPDTKEPTKVFFPSSRLAILLLGVGWRC